MDYKIPNNPVTIFWERPLAFLDFLHSKSKHLTSSQSAKMRSPNIYKYETMIHSLTHWPTHSSNNKLAKLRRHASRVHFAKIHFRYIHFWKIHFWKIRFMLYALRFSLFHFSLFTFHFFTFHFFTFSLFHFSLFTFSLFTFSNMANQKKL